MNEQDQTAAPVHHLENPDGVTEVDLAVIIPSFEEAQNIELPTRKMAAGIVKHYPRLRSVIINCDNNSRDGTRAAFWQADCDLPRIYISSPPGVRGKGANLVNGFRAAGRLSARVVAVVDANVSSVKTTWIKSLVEPILNGCAEYVSPLYVRHKYETPITRVLAYPLTRALYGRRVMQPISVDHAFSARVNDLYLNLPWETDDRGYKSDLQMLAAAVMNNVPICQSFMAHPRITTMGKLDYDLPKALGYVIKALFNRLLADAAYWTKVTRTRPTAVAGADLPPVNPAPPVSINEDYAMSVFIDLGRRDREHWRSFLPEDLAAEAEALLDLALAGERPRMSVLSWRRMVFEGLLAYRRADEAGRGRIASSLATLFFPKGLDITLATGDFNDRRFNALMEEEALVFEAGRKELTERWNRDA